MSSESHRQTNDPSLNMAHDPAGSPSDPRPDLLKPDDLRKELKVGQTQRVVPLLYRIYDAKAKKLITPTQA